MVITSFCWASDWETYDSIQRLLAISEPSAPVIYQNLVIFTADSSLRRVGIAFAHENFAHTYWFSKLLLFDDRPFIPVKEGDVRPLFHIDSGIQFYVYQLPAHIRELEYRLVINGLWTTDPLNSLIRRDPVSGLNLSVLNLPSRPTRQPLVNSQGEGLYFSYSAPSGESITVAGTFNGWDPFMYELREGPAGTYSLHIPLPPGTYQYVFFRGGQRYVDPQNPRRIYARDGSAASEIVIPY